MSVLVFKSVADVDAAFGAGYCDCEKALDRRTVRQVIEADLKARPFLIKLAGDAPAQTAGATLERCPVCTVGEPSDEPHECPFKSGIHNSQEMCRCCRSCAYQCAMGV